MVKKTGVGVLLSLVFVLFAYSSVLADTPVFKDGKWYGTINAGAMFLHDVDFGANLNYGGVLTVNVAGEASFETGPSIGGAIGYILNNHVRAEFELGYTEMDHDKAKADAAWTFTSGGTTLTGAGGLEVEVDGEVEALYGLANVILTPLGSQVFEGTKLTPLVGGGIGFVDWDDEIKSISSAGTTLTVNAKESDTDLLTVIMLGLEYDYSENMSLAIKFRHFWAYTGKNGVEDAEADNLLGSLRFKF